MTLVSVIVTTKNEEANIQRCLDSIRRQTYKNTEVIVVDNNSTDKTKEIAKRYTPLVFNLGPERSAQRNFGIRQGRGEIALYIDADMALSPGVVAACVEAFDKNPDHVGLYIPERIVGQGFWIKVRDHERSFYDGTVIDAVRAIRRETFVMTGGFDESLTGVEDWDFDLRIRQVGKTHTIEAPLFHNEKIFALRTYLKKKAYYGQSFAAYHQKWGELNPSVKKQFDVIYRYFGVFTENRKYIRLLRHPILTFGMFCLRVAVGAGYLAQVKKNATNIPSSYPPNGQKESSPEHEQSA